MASGAVDANPWHRSRAKRVVGAALHRVDHVHLPAADQRPVDQTLRQAGLPGAGEPGQQQVRVQGRVVGDGLPVDADRERDALPVVGGLVEGVEVERRQLRQRVVPGDQQPQRVRAGAGPDLQEVVAGGGPQFRQRPPDPGRVHPGGQPEVQHPDGRVAGERRGVHQFRQQARLPGDAGVGPGLVPVQGHQPQPVRARVGQPGVLRPDPGEQHAAGVGGRDAQPRGVQGLPDPGCPGADVGQGHPAVQPQGDLPDAARAAMGGQAPGRRQLGAGEPGGVERGVHPAGEHPLGRGTWGEVLWRSMCGGGRPAHRERLRVPGAGLRRRRPATR